mmetsp:Transcript_20234/g.65006  ORF Transcript_20234/g.65006 Transcript_20234/m.65006 type:complete len:211 (+) Transcript_20234:517-1149(+)
MRAAVLTASPHKSYLFTYRGSCGEKLFAARPGVVGEISTGRSCAYSQLQAETTLFTPQTPHVPDRMCPITPAMAEPKSMPTCTVSCGALGASARSSRLTTDMTLIIAKPKPAAAAARSCGSGRRVGSGRPAATKYCSLAVLRTCACTMKCDHSAHASFRGLDFIFVRRTPPPSVSARLLQLEDVCEAVEPVEHGLQQLDDARGLGRCVVQ